MSIPIRTAAGALHPAVDPDWYLDPANLAQLWRWLTEIGETPSDPADFMEKPWKWLSEWRQMWTDRTRERAA